MSIIYCETCQRTIDTDYDDQHQFGEDGSIYCDVLDTVEKIKIVSGEKPPQVKLFCDNDLLGLQDTINTWLDTIINNNHEIVSITHDTASNEYGVYMTAMIIFK